MSKHQIERVINKRVNQIRILYVVILLTILGILLSTPIIHWLSIIVVILLVIIVTPTILESSKEYKELYILKSTLKEDPQKFKEIIDLEVVDLHTTIKNQTTQSSTFPTHLNPQRVNLRRNRKAIAAARNNAKSIRRKYLLYKKMQDLVTPIVQELQKDPYNI